MECISSFYNNTQFTYYLLAIFPIRNFYFSYLSGIWVQ